MKMMGRIIGGVIGSAIGRRKGNHTMAGAVIGASREGIDIACGQGVLRLLRLQREGGKPITAQDYLNARHNLLA